GLVEEIRVGLQHRRQEQPGEPHHRLNVQTNHQDVAFGRILPELPALTEARIVHQDVDAGPGTRERGEEFLGTLSCARALASGCTPTLNSRSISIATRSTSARTGATMMRG